LPTRIAAPCGLAMTKQAIRALGKPAHVLYDLKYILPAQSADLRL
jgi:UDP-N-acetyl-D-galactosamine dehydrogenase